MNPFEGLGKTLLVFGVVLAAVGVVLMFAGKIPWLGKMPGDIVIKRDNFSFYFPLGTCLLISIVISLVLRIFRK